MRDDAAIQLRLLGGASMRSGAVVHALEAKVAALLCVLAVDGGAARAAVAALLWPDVDAAGGRRNLRQRIFQLHRLAGRELIRGRQTLRLAEGVSTDVAVPAAAAATGSAWAPAEVDGGELLAGFEYGALTDFSAWLAAARRRRLDASVDAWSAAASAHEAAGEYAAAIVLAQRIVATDALLEHGHRRLMRLHYLRGDSAAAVAAFEHCEGWLRAELGVRPHEETLALLRTIESGAACVPAPATTAFVPVAVRRPPQRVGRDGEWAQLAAAWAAEQSFLVVGEAGMGKSRLLGDFAAATGASVARSRPGDAAVPLALLERLLRALLLERPTLGDANVRAELATLVPEWAAARAPTAPASNAALRLALTRFLAAASQGGLTALLFDDLQFADPASLDMLAALAGAPALGTLRWGFAMRPVAGFAGERFGLLIALPPLTAPAMAQLVESLGLAGVDATRLAGELSQHTGGNPFFALETIKQLIAGGAAPVGSPARLPRPASVTALIETRLRSLSPAALALARVAAVAAPNFGMALAEEVLGAHTLALADAWSELEAAHILRGVAFAHDLIHETAQASVPAVVAARLHGLVARSLETGDAEPAHIAAHWEAAGVPAAAAPQWLRAAESARARGSAVPAARLCEQAAAAYDRCGQADAAFDALCLAAGHLSYHGSTEQFAAIVGRLVERAVTPAARARAWFWRAHLDDLHGAPIEDVEQALRAGLLEAIASAQPTIEAEYRFGLGMVAWRRCELQSAAEQFAAAATLMESSGMSLEAAEVRTVLGAVMAALGRLDESTRWLHSSAPVLEQRGAHNTLGYNRMRLAVNAESRGRGEEAAAWHGRSLALLNRVDPGAHDWCVIAAPMIESLSAAGRYGQALAIAHDASLRLSGQTLSRRVILDLAVAHLYLGLGRPEQAVQAARFSRLHLDPVSLARVNLFELALSQHGGHAAAQVAVDLGAAERVGLRFALAYALLAAERLAPTAASRLLATQIGAAERAGMWGVVPALLAALARQRAADGDAEGALTAARRAGELLGAHTPATPPPGLHFDLMQTYRALGLADDAHRAARAGADWLRQRLAADVPEEFRDSIQQRHPVHRALLLAARAAPA